jgi:hypothetical protein
LCRYHRSEPDVQIYDYSLRSLPSRPLPRPPLFRAATSEYTRSQISEHQSKLAQARAEWAQRAKQRSEERLKLTRARNIERLAREATLEWDNVALLGEGGEGTPFDRDTDASVRDNLYGCLVDACVNDLRARTKHRTPDIAAPVSDMICRSSIACLTYTEGKARTRRVRLFNYSVRLSW